MPPAAFRSDLSAFQVPLFDIAHDRQRGRPLPTSGWEAKFPDRLALQVVARSSQNEAKSSIDAFDTSLAVIYAAPIATLDCMSGGSTNTSGPLANELRAFWSR
jgi:hypothetical protein